MACACSVASLSENYSDSKITATKFPHPREGQKLVPYTHRRIVPQSGMDVRTKNLVTVTHAIVLLVSRLHTLNVSLLTQWGGD